MNTFQEELGDIFPGPVQVASNSRALRRRIASIVSDALIASLAQHDIPTLTDAEAWLSRIHNARAVSDTLVAMTLLAVEEGTEAK